MSTFEGQGKHRPRYRQRTCYSLAARIEKFFERQDADIEREPAAKKLYALREKMLEAWKTGRRYATKGETANAETWMEIIIETRKP